MKLADIEKIHAAGHITDEQRDRIVEHFKLHEEGSKFLNILVWIGAVLAAAGVILLISTNWDAIPRLLKVVCGMALLLGAHTGGWWLREVRHDFPKAGEALHFIGACLFLANIALIGQVYNISSRLPNAFAFWFVGVTPLAWILRSKAVHLLSLLAFGIWFGMELDSRDGLFHYAGEGEQFQFLLFAMLALCYLGLGGILRRTSYSDFSGPTEKLGLLGFNLGLYPLTWSLFVREGVDWLQAANPLFIVLTALGIAFAFLGMRRDDRLNTQWRWTWLGALLGGVVLAWIGWWWCLFANDSPTWRGAEEVPVRWLAIIFLFVFALLQIQVAVQAQSRFQLNLGVVMVALVIITAYLDLFGSMALTGTMFLLSGLFLIVFSIYLEKHRRKLMRRLKEGRP